MDARWRIDLLGGLRAEGEGRVVIHFETRKTAALLAFLAYHLGRPHPRETLVERFWPEEDPEATRARFRQTLACLRRALEPPGVPPGSVLLADRLHVQLQPGAIVTDVALFEEALRRAAQATSPAERVNSLQT